MTASLRLERIDVFLNGAAFAVGSAVTRGAGMMRGLVRRASGLEAPSSAAVAAGLVRGVATLAPSSLGTIGGTAVEIAGELAVFALATWTVRESSRDDEVLIGAIAFVEHRGLCSAHAAELWRVAVGASPARRELVVREVLALLKSAARTAASQPLVSVTKNLLVIGVALTCADAWVGMGEAARLVETTRGFAIDHARDLSQERALSRFDYPLAA
ncbi:MAG: hypothetical protein J0I07_04580 [Myxococcales bacterium]|nr:hypothetical protein [Myxococcales bacterium]